VALGEWPLSANGEVDRRTLPAPPETGPEPYHVEPRSPMESALVEIWRDVLGLEQVGVHDNFFELGGDSILSIQVVSRARKEGLNLRTKDLFIHQTVAELAPVVREEETGDSDGGPVVGPVPLTPIQHWFFQTHTVNPAHFNQSMLVELTDDLNLEALERALEALLWHHDALRMRFVQVDGQWRQRNAPVEPLGVLYRHDITLADPGEQLAAMESVANDVHASFDLGRGPLLKACLFRFVGGQGRRPYLLLVGHHLIVDVVSWRILFDDLDTAYQQAAGGEVVDLGPKTTSFRHWAHRLVAHVAEGHLDHELYHWARALDESAVPVDGKGSEPPPPPQTVPVLMSTEDTDALLRGATTTYRTRINEVLLSGLAWALGRWTQRSRVSIDLEGHGREDVLDGIDLTRTVGWFTTIYPVALEVPLEDDPDWRALIKSVRRQLRAVPGNGVGFGALRYLGSPSALGRLPVETPGPQVVFNYTGQADPGSATHQETGLYRSVEGSFGQEHDPAERDPHLLEVLGDVTAGQLGFTWYYRPDVHDRATVEAVARDFADALRRIAAGCRESM